MLSVFPSLLSWSQLSPFLIRLAIGSVFIFWGYRSIRGTRSDSRAKITSAIEGATGILFVIGLWTQVAALIAVIDLIIRLITKMMERRFLSDGVNYYLLLLVMAISLLITGAGVFAFDLPL